MEENTFKKKVSAILANPKIAVSTACLYPKTVEESLYDLALNDINNVEIHFSAPIEAEKIVAHRLKDIMQRFEINCDITSSFLSEFDPILLFSEYKRKRESYYEYSKHVFSASAELGAKYYIFQGCRENTIKDFDFYIEVYSNLQEIAKSFGISILQENVYGYESSKTRSLRILKTKLGSNFEMILDLKQAARQGKNPLLYLSTMGKDIKAVHISDSSEYGDGLLPGKGRFDFKTFIPSVIRKNPNIIFIIDVSKAKFQSTSELEASCKLIKSFIKGREI